MRSERLGHSHPLDQTIRVIRVIRVNVYFE